MNSNKKTNHVGERKIQNDQKSLKYKNQENSKPSNQTSGKSAFFIKFKKRYAVKDNWRQIKHLSQQELVASEESVQNFNNTIQDSIFECKNYFVDAYTKYLLKNINIKLENKKITALIGPSGAGKSTFLTSLNRLLEEKSNVKFQGELLFHNNNIFDKKINIYNLRKLIGMVFQRPTPFALSVFDNVAYGPRIHGVKNKNKLKEIVKNALNDAALYDEVADNWNDNALNLSGGQQQRLCIARALAVNPEIILFDEPTSALDPIATEKIENLILKLNKKYTVIIITHSLSQAARCSQNLLFFYEGFVIGYDKTMNMFSNPQNKIVKKFFKHSAY